MHSSKSQILKPNSRERRTMSVKKVLTNPLETKTTMTKTLKLELKTELLKWICERHATNGPLDRKLLREKTMEIAASFGVIGFKCSEAFLTVFLKKHGFSPSLTNCNGPTFTDYRVWIDLLRSLITQYRYKDLFNVEELIMYSNFLPSRKEMNKPLHEDGDNILENHEKFLVSSQTKRIAILLCCNSSGTEKLEPLISNPYVLEKSHDGTRQKRHDACGISDDNFTIWLEKLNTQMSNSHRNILLLLSRDRIHSLHNFQKLSNVKLVFLPKDFPTQLRPLRGDIFHFVKMTYRRRYVEFMRRRESMTREWSTTEIVQSIFQAWQQVPQELVVSSFQRTKFREDESFLKIQCPEWDSFETGMSFHKYVTFDDKLCDASNRGSNDETTFSNSNNIRYNLRKSCRETVEVSDDPDEILGQKSTGVQNMTKRNNEITKNVTCDKISFNNQLSSRTRNIQEPQENNEFTNSKMVQFMDLPSTIRRGEIVSNPIALQTISVGTTMSCFEHPEIVNSSLSKIYENPEKRKILMDRCLRGVNFSNSDLTTKGGSKIGDFEKFGRIDGNSAQRDELNDRVDMEKKEAENFPGEAGPSGKECEESQEILQDVNIQRPLESDNEEEEAQDDGELRLKILTAIQICEELEGRNGQKDHIEANDPSAGRSKRSRPGSSIEKNYLNDDDEPPNKVARTDGNWSKCYETNFVFGTETSINCNENVPQSSMNDNATNQESSATNISLINRTVNDEVDKRCRFALEESTSSPNETYPNTKD